MVPSCLFRCSFHTLTIVLSVVLVTLAFYDTRERRSLLDYHHHKSDDVDLFNGCDLFSGKWVYDNKSYPLYKDRDCGFMFDDLACEKYGRKDLNYRHWKWQPHGCDLPRYPSLSLHPPQKNKVTYSYISVKFFL